MTTTTATLLPPARHIRYVHERNVRASVARDGFGREQRSLLQAIEKDGTGIEKNGTGIEKDGTGIEKNGTGITRRVVA